MNPSDSSVNLKIWAPLYGVGKDVESHIKIIMSILKGSYNPPSSKSLGHWFLLVANAKAQSAVGSCDLARCSLRTNRRKLRKMKIS